MRFSEISVFFERANPLDLDAVCRALDQLEGVAACRAHDSTPTHIPDLIIIAISAAIPVAGLVATAELLVEHGALNMRRVTDAVTAPVAVGSDVEQVAVELARLRDDPSSLSS
jgi:hypothetical protein